MNITSLIQKASSLKTEQLLIKAGGKPAQEGEVRTRADGTKWRKTGKTWVQVVDKKQKKEQPTKQGPKQNKPEQSKQKNIKPEESQNQVSKHEKAQLSQMKKIVESDRTKAYEIYQSLSPESQQHVPQSIVDKLVEHSTKPEVDSSVIKEYDGFDSMMNIQNGKETLFNESLAEGWFSSMEPDFEYLSDEDIDTLEVYRGSGYDEINGTLRDTLDENEETFLGDDEIEKRINILTKAIENSPGLRQNTVVHRGIQLLHQPVSDFFNSLQIGDVYSDPAFCSTSISKNVAEKEFKKDLDVERGLSIKILLPKGTKGIPLLSTKMKDVNKKEWEFLLNRDTEFEVLERIPGQMTVIVK